MTLSEFNTAKGLKVKFTFQDTSVEFLKGNLLRIDETKNESEFIVNQYGQGVSASQGKTILCKTDSISADYIRDLLSTEKSNQIRCLFSIEGINESSLEVQAYTFEAVTEYKTAINIQVSDKILERTTLDKLYKEYVWQQLGVPAVFCLNFKRTNKQQADVRFYSGRRGLTAHNTVRGIIAESEYFLKERDYQPTYIYIAPLIQFIPISENADSNDKLAEDLDKVTNPQSYFARWEAYNELSKKALALEREEFGKIKYSSYKIDPGLNTITFEFSIDDELDNSLVGKELCVINENNIDMEDEKNYPTQTAVGTVRKVNGKTIATCLEGPNGLIVIPDSGYLSLYTVGNKFIMARRDAAHERMKKHQSPIKSIIGLIESGASEYELLSDWDTNKAVTEELKRNFKKASELTPEQANALDLAINTPDIAIIQGPPGTGKTTVIKAICERFREIYEEKERKYQKMNPDYMVHSPKILISSFQNDAVDNAISTPLPGDIPAYRKTSRRVKDSTREQYQKSLDRWYESVVSSIKSLVQVKTATDYVEAKKYLNDEYLSYKNQGESLSVAAELIKHYLSYTEIHYPTELLDAAQVVVRASDNTYSEDDTDPVIDRINSQRLDGVSFADDGQRNARRLAAHLKIRDDLEFPEDAIEIIQKVCDDGYSNADFLEYISLIEKLKKKYCKQKAMIDVKDKAVVNECLMAMSSCFNKQYISTLSDVESKKSLILSEFLSRLEQEYETIVEKYSTTTAATCQTCLDLKGESNQVFDLVIVDEAARANPLDLFIPMSMGKKIVLVGDQKQLPHMLEPDVIKLIMNDPRFNDLPEIEKSLFERLFEMFSKGQNPKAIMLTQQFRMHPEICEFVSNAFYDGQLKTFEKITPELRSSPMEINDGRALTFVNVPAKLGLEVSGISKSRPAEVDAVSNEVKKILKVEPDTTIGVITFYSAQATKIKQSLEQILDAEELNHIEVGTVDAFQGKEFNYVLLSCVRSNIPQKAGELPSIGFLEKPNRLCVAFSRAIKQLIVFGDVETLSQIPCFSRLYNLCALEGGGCYREYRYS